MRWFSRKPEVKAAQFEQVIARIIAATGDSPSSVTPDSCMRAPTVHAVVTAISNRMAVTPLHVYRKTSDDGRDSKQKEPNHPVSQLLAMPNEWQTPVNFITDAASVFVRHGNFYAYKSQGGGKTRALIPLPPPDVTPKLEDNQRFHFKVKESDGYKEYGPDKILHVRGAARNFVEGDSPISDIKNAIALEIAAEEMGEAFFRNGALPLVVFRYMQGFQAFKTKEEEDEFVNSFQRAFSGSKKFRAMLMPKGIEQGDDIDIANDKAQFLETRKHQRTVIAGAFGVPPHLVGDLERGTFNNVEQQDKDFTLNVIMPVVRSFESAMERDLLSKEDRERGYIIRFNLDSTLRASFKERQEGLKIQREMGVINPDEWREIEGMNPRADDGGEGYWDQGPSGQGMANGTQSSIA